MVADPRAARSSGKQQFCVARRFLHFLQGRAGLHGQGLLRGVDLLHGRHAFQRQDQIAGRRVGRRHQVGAPTVGDDRLARRVAELSTAATSAVLRGRTMAAACSGDGSIQLVARVVTSGPVRRASGPRSDCSWASRADMIPRHQKPTAKTQRNKDMQRRRKVCSPNLALRSFVSLRLRVSCLHPREHRTEPPHPFHQLLFFIETQNSGAHSCAMRPGWRSGTGPIAHFVVCRLRQDVPASTVSGRRTQKK